MIYGQRPGCVNHSTFSFQGKEYPLNTTVKIKDCMFTSTGNALYCYPMVQVVEAFIDKNGTNRWTYALWKYNGNVWHYTTIRSPDELVECIVNPYINENTTKEPEYYKDSEVSGMALGWFIYIASMIFVTVFNGFYVAWIFGTWYFFTWRKEKLKKPVKIMHGYDVHKKVEGWNDEWKT